MQIKLLKIIIFITKQEKKFDDAKRRTNSCTKNKGCYLKLITMFLLLAVCMFLAMDLFFVVKCYTKIKNIFNILEKFLKSIFCNTRKK